VESGANCGKTGPVAEGMYFLSLNKAILFLRRCFFSQENEKETDATKAGEYGSQKVCIFYH